MRLAIILAGFLVSFAHGVEPQWRYLPSDTKMTLTVHPQVLTEADRANGEKIFLRLYRVVLARELDAKDDKLLIRDLDRIMWGFPAAGSLHHVMILRGKVDTKLLTSQMKKVADASKALIVEEMGTPAVPVFRRALDEATWKELAPQLAALPAAIRKIIAPSDIYLAAVDEQTIFISLTGKSAMQRALRARPAKSPRIGDDLLALLKKQDTKDIAAFNLLPDSLAPGLALVVDDETRETFEQFNSITTRIIGGKDVGIHLVIDAKSNEIGGVLEARSKRAIKNFAAALPSVFPGKEQREAMSKILDGLRVERKDSEIKIAGTVPADIGRKVFPEKK